ncbi:hypothetical protein ScPMuIL_010178 [Solemya velum]
MTNTYEKVVGVISKPPNLRQDFEIQPLLPWLRKKSELFFKLKTDFLKDIVRNCHLRTYDTDDIIIRQGDRGECFFILLGGIVSIFMLNKDWENKAEEKSTLGTIGLTQEDGSLDRSKLGNFVCNLEPGMPFGEVALMSNDCIRTASIIAGQPTDVLVVDRELYNRAVRDVLAHEFQEKAAFIQNNPVFQKWLPKYAKMLAMAMYKETFQYGDSLVRQGEPVENIYFIVRGQVQVQIDTTLYRRQFPSVYTTDADLQRSVSEFTCLPYLSHRRSGSVKKIPKHRQKYARRQVINAFCLAINESIGETEFLMDLDSNIHTAVCIESTDVLVLERKHYDRLLVKRHPKSIESMRKILETKMNTRLELTNDQNMEFHKFLKKKLHSMNQPIQTVKKHSELSSVEIAEKEFLSHRGPLIDMFGPGSVFHLIRLREKSKIRLSSNAVRPKRKQDLTSEVLQTLGIPTSLYMAAGVMEDVQELESITLPNTNQRYSDESSEPLKKLTNTYGLRKSNSKYETNINDETLDSPDETDVDDFSDDLSDYFSSLNNSNNDAELTILEARMQDWLSRDNSRHPQVSHLKRVSLEEMGAVPKPGNIVVMRPKKTPLDEKLVIREEGEDRLSISDG